MIPSGRQSDTGQLSSPVPVETDRDITSTQFPGMGGSAQAQTRLPCGMAVKMLLTEQMQVGDKVPDLKGGGSPGVLGGPAGSRGSLSTEVGGELTVQHWGTDKPWLDGERREDIVTRTSDRQKAC